MENIARKGPFTKALQEDRRIIGLLGGMSGAATADYYRLINAGTKRIHGGHHIAELLLYSVNFHHIERIVREAAWDEAAGYLGDKARRLEAAGAEFLVLVSNTMHRVAARIQDAVGIPLLHIADCVAAAIRTAGLTTVGLLGTAPVMRDEYYKRYYLERHAIQVMSPSEDDQVAVNQIIFEELCHGKVLEASRRRLLEIAAGLQRRGACGLILGCTELGMLLPQSEPWGQCFDSLKIHVEKAIEISLGRAPLPERFEDV